MKKILAIFLLLVYAASAFGIAVNYHYCNGHLTNVTVVNLGNHNCNCNPDGSSEGCCKDKMIYLKGDNHKSSQISFIPSQTNFAGDVPAYTSLFSYKEFFSEPTLLYHFVKPEYPQPIFILNSVFKI